MSTFSREGRRQVSEARLHVQVRHVQCVLPDEIPSWLHRVAINLVKMSSASSSSETFTRSSERTLESRVVSQSWSGFICKDGFEQIRGAVGDRVGLLAAGTGRAGEGRGGFLGTRQTRRAMLFFASPIWQAIVTRCMEPAAVSKGLMWNFILDCLMLPDLSFFRS